MDGLGELGRHFLAFDGVTPVGLVVVHTSSYDNLDLAWLALMIHPAHRRQGLGTAALEAAYDICRGMKRDLLGLDGWESDQTRGFAKAAGFEQKSQSINRRQHLAEVPTDGIAQLMAAADEMAGDYELLRFDGRTPDELMDDVARMSDAINDAPLDDLEIEDEVYSPDRIRGPTRLRRSSRVPIPPSGGPPPGDRRAGGKLTRSSRWTPNDRRSATSAPTPRGAGPPRSPAGSAQGRHRPLAGRGRAAAATIEPGTPSPTTTSSAWTGCSVTGSWGGRWSSRDGICSRPARTYDAERRSPRRHSSRSGLSALHSWQASITPTT